MDTACALRELSPAIKNMDKKESDAIDIECTKHLIEEGNIKTQSDILIFNRGILNAPVYIKSISLWRYLHESSILYHQYSEVGNIVPVDRFLSTGTSPIERKSSRDRILLRIDLPPTFPFWMLSSGVEYTESLEHREVVLPYTTDISGKTLDYGLLVKKVTKNPVMRAEGTELGVSLLSVVTPVLLKKPIKLHYFKPSCDN